MWKKSSFKNWTYLWTPENCWLAAPCHLDKKWLKIYHNFIQALWFLITHLETKNSFYATVKTSRPYIMQWIDVKIVFWRRAFIHSKSMDATEWMINLHVQL